jgi:hypothetical protein
VEILVGVRAGARISKELWETGGVGGGMPVFHTKGATRDNVAI